jgi:hypothetical protein
MSRPRQPLSAWMNLEQCGRISLGRVTIGAGDEACNRGRNRRGVCGIRVSVSGIDAFRRLRAEVGRWLPERWTRSVQSGLRASESSGMSGFERFMSEFEARNRLQQSPRTGGNTRRR